VSWDSPRVITPEPSIGVTDPNNLDPSTNTAPETLRTGHILPEPAISSTGQLYVTWEGFDPGSNLDQAFITTSSDGGASWSAPAVVNSSNTTRSAYTPAITVASDGTVAVTYYQWDGATTSGAEPTMLYIQKSTSGGSSSTPPTFGARTAVSAEFNTIAAPGWWLLPR